MELMLAHRNLSIEPSEHTLDEHSKMVALLCADFAKEIGPEYTHVGSLLGLLHDFGKLHPAFQKYLLAVTEDPPSRAISSPHAILGAYYIGKWLEDNPGLRTACQYIISGHHRGLYDYTELCRNLTNRVKSRIKECHIPDYLEEQVLELIGSISSLPTPSALHTKMLFSALVDADFLDTEAFMNGVQSQARVRYAQKANLSDLEEKLKHYISGFSREGEVNRARRTFLDQALQAGDEAQERVIHTLNLPTGGGKTITSMAWALRCAGRLGHSRIIYVIPYTSIITQTAGIFRSVFGEHVVLEHHSDIDLAEDEDEAYTRVKLLSENWDVPIVVTTNVQFFESIFSHKVSKCRKLHNICNSVVVFDEVQMFPTGFLNSILRTIDQLCRDFHCSILLSSATQPPFEEGVKQKYSLSQGIYALNSPLERIVPYDKSHFGLFDHRVEWHLDKEMLSSDRLAERLAKCEQVLCIVNSRKDAALVYNAVKTAVEDGVKVLHLSRMMCSAHLADRLAEVKECLRLGTRVIVVSTQLIEAGVDLDFPVVYRAFAGIDSIVQAGGRCNREGKLNAKGHLYVFDLDDGSSIPRGIRDGQYASGDVLLNQNHERPDEALIIDYYRSYYNICGNGDKKGICPLLWNEAPEWDFETASKNFVLIDDRGTIDLYVPYGTEGGKLLTTLSNTQKLDRIGRRRLQRFRVGLPKKDFDVLGEGGMIQRIELWGDPNQGIYLLSDLGTYSDEVGLRVENHWLTDILIQ